MDMGMEMGMDMDMCMDMDMDMGMDMGMDMNVDMDEDMDMEWRIIVEQESMEARGLSADDFVIDVEVIPSAKLALIMSEQEIVISG